MSRSRREWRGLEGSDAPPPPPQPMPFSCSSVSRTTSGACVCFAALCLSSLLSSVRAASCMSCDTRGRHEKPKTHRNGAAAANRCQLYLRAVLHLGENLGVQRPVVAEALGASCRSRLPQLWALHLNHQKVFNEHSSQI